MDWASNSSSFSSMDGFLQNLHPNPLMVDATETLGIAMERIEEIICIVHPTIISEYRRNEIIDFLKSLIENSFGGVEVLPVGSMPLKTYLPDGDIDLTIMSAQYTEETLVNRLYNILRDEEAMNSVYQVRDVEIIPAQVRIVKCRVENIRVDLSINQEAGVRVTNFLQQVDELIGQDHIFKRSLILLKAWCFYESRILSSSNSLICTYGLDVMIVHLFNLYHHLLNSPLAVLYKFLEYYNTLDWERFGVAINGQLHLSLLPHKIALELPPDSHADLLLTDEFLRRCKESTVVKYPTISQLQKRFFNILDPLNDDNNLGRSVNKANFKRIKCAFAHGFDQLKEVLTQPKENTEKGIDHFFRTTLQVNTANRSSPPSIGRDFIKVLVPDEENYDYGTRKPDSPPNSPTPLADPHPLNSSVTLGYFSEVQGGETIDSSHNSNISSNNSFYLNPEEFPTLPGFKPPNLSMEKKKAVRKDEDHKIDSSPLTLTSTSVSTIVFGTFNPLESNLNISLLGMSSQSSNGLPPKSNLDEETQGLLSSKEEIIVVNPPRLDDINDFPPLKLNG